MARRKWELVHEGVRGTKTVSNPILGYESTYKCIYDVFRKRRRNGLYKFKHVEH